MFLTDGHSTLKRDAVAYTGFGMLDVYRLLVAADGTIRVHVERRERSGAHSEAYLYEGADLDAATFIYNHLTGGAA